MGSSRDNSRPTRRLLGMAVPNFQSLMRTVLVALEDGQIRPGKEIQEVVRTALGLTGDDLAHVLSSGQSVVYNPVQWASTHLAKAGAVERPSRGQFQDHRPWPAPATDLRPSHHHR